MGQPRASRPDIDPTIGTRIRRIRIRQGKSQREVAQLAGIGAPHLSRIENGLRPLDSRSLAHQIATALQVPISTLFEEPAVDSDAAVAAGSLRLALAAVNLAGAPTAPPPPWEELLATRAVMETLRPRADYVGVALMLPDVLVGLHAHTDGPHRREALLGLASGFRAAQTVARNVGAHDLALFAGHQLAAVAARLDGPEWVGLSSWATALGLGTISRQQARDAALAGLDQLDGQLDNPRAVDVAGMLHLLAAQSAAVLGQGEIGEHLDEAYRLAQLEGTGGFANLRFTPWNVTAWNTSIAVERGESGRAMQLAQRIDEAGAPPSRSRHAAWLIDMGRAASSSSRTRPVAKRAFLEAEQLAPQMVRANPWAKVTVTDLRNRSRKRDWELEQLAERLGVG